VYSITSAAGSGQEVDRKGYTFVGSGEDKPHFSCKHTEKNVFLYDVERTNYTFVGNRQKKLYFCTQQRRKTIFFVENGQKKLCIYRSNEEKPNFSSK
jgi:hypothetical protein